MKILHVVNVSFVIPYFLGNQITYFDSKGHQIFIACSPSNHFDDLSKIYSFQKINVEISRQFNFKTDLISTFKLLYIIKKNNFDVVVGHTPKAAFIAMVASSLTHTKKRIYFRHGFMFETSNGLKRKLLKFIEIITSKLSTNIFNVSKSVIENSKKYNIYSYEKNVLINNGSCNGIDISHYNYDPYIRINKPFFNFKNKFVIGYVGRIVKDKGIEELINAWKIITKTNSNFILLLVGPFETRDSINVSTINYIKNEKSIYFTNLVSDTLKYYNLMDIFILPSYREGLPTVVLEASSMELPIITTRNTGCIDSIIENSTGVFTDLSTNDIVSKILFFYNNPEVRLKYGFNGREFVIKHFDQKKIWNSLLELYTS